MSHVNLSPESQTNVKNLDADDVPESERRRIAGQSDVRLYGDFGRRAMDSCPPAHLCQCCGPRLFQEIDQIKKSIAEISEKFRTWTSPAEMAIVNAKLNAEAAKLENAAQGVTTGK